MQAIDNAMSLVVSFLQVVNSIVCKVRHVNVNNIESNAKHKDRQCHGNRMNIVEIRKFTICSISVYIRFSGK